jgi:glycosyltransferase involved in cell wall biosynthesis
VIQTVAATREDSGQFKYKLPNNITQVSESFLRDDDIVLKKKYVKYNPSKKERKAILSLMFSEDEHWEVIFDLFQKNAISLNDILMGVDFFEDVKTFYNERYERVVFTDFLWTTRSVYLPLFTVLKNRFPKADLYHAVSTGYAGIVAACAAHIHNRPLLLTEHGIYTREREEEIIRSAWTRGIYKNLWIDYFYMLSRCIYNRADKVFSLFNRARDTQLEIGCPADKVEVIPNGVKYDLFQNLPPRDPNDKSINIAAILRVTPIKDVKTMISAFHHAKEKIPQLNLYIIGSTEEDPDYYNECVALIGMLGAQGITFTGHVNIRDYLSRMDICMLTSISEAQPLSLLEAMAAGIPCISTNVGDCYDMMNAGDEDGAAGIVTTVMNVGQIAHSIIRLASNEDLRRKMGENGRRMVDAKYRDNAFIDRYREIYAEFGKR